MGVNGRHKVQPELISSVPCLGVQGMRSGHSYIQGCQLQGREGSEIQDGVVTEGGLVVFLLF